jgi:hypothetical protein
MVLLSSKCRNPKMDLLCRVAMQKPEEKMIFFLVLVLCWLLKPYVLYSTQAKKHAYKKEFQ